MAAGSLLALLDDIATILDDVSVMTQMAAKKTAGVLGDDLALNAQQVSGVAAERELPVVWAVAKGSFVNKLILVPSALAISYFAPWAITPLLMLGGAYLCFEGFEKIAEKYLHGAKEEEKHDKALDQAVANPDIDLVTLEKDKIKGAIRTDFVLSAEIIVIALGTVATATFSKQATVVSIIAIIMTVGVYGLVNAEERQKRLQTNYTQNRVLAIGRNALFNAHFIGGWHCRNVYGGRQYYWAWPAIFASFYRARC
jgi:uncharacterized protein